MIRFLKIGRIIITLKNSSCQPKVCCRSHLSKRLASQRVVEYRRRTFKDIEEEAAGKEKLDAFALSLLVVPITTFGLGVWQVQRKAWKEDLIADLEKRRSHEPLPLPENLDDLEGMEYYPVIVKGRFHHDRELCMGPRSLLIKEGKGNYSGGMFSQSKSGYLIVTPFELSDSGKTILVNRGWVPLDKLRDKSRTVGEHAKEVEFTGVVRLNESRKPFGMKNTPEKNVWVHRDIHKMAEVANTEPVFIDADAASTIPGGPIGGQTRISLRNEHLSYIVTWFGLSVASAFLWYMKYIKLA